MRAAKRAGSRVRLPSAQETPVAGTPLRAESFTNIAGMETDGEFRASGLTDVMRTELWIRLVR